MRILTVQQPWAWAIIHGGKNIENRTQPWSYRGPLVIHAGNSPQSMHFASDPRILAALREHPEPRPELAARTGSGFGLVIGAVDLVDVHPASIGASTCCAPWGDWTPDTCHLVLENPRPIDPIPAKGRLGLWHDVDLLAEVRVRLRQNAKTPCAREAVR